MTLEIRPEREHDQRAIGDLTRLAFAGKPYAGGDEQDVIDRLREASALSGSLVAVEGGIVIGQVSFSPAANSDAIGDWYALGPIAVRPDHQGEGIGGALIEAGIEAIAKRGAAGCILTGDPGYYTRQGFVPAPEHCPPSEPAEYFLVRTIGEQKLVGRFAFHGAFYGDA